LSEVKKFSATGNFFLIKSPLKNKKFMLVRLLVFKIICLERVCVMLCLAVI